MKSIILNEGSPLQGVDIYSDSPKFKIGYITSGDDLFYPSSLSIGFSVENLTEIITILQTNKAQKDKIKQG